MGKGWRLGCGQESLGGGGLGVGEVLGLGGGQEGLRGGGLGIGDGLRIGGGGGMEGGRGGSEP